MPLETLTGKKIAFLGMTGSGKTYAAMKLAEEMLEAKAQIVVIDPVGVWYGLRIAADGKGKGFDIPVFGGLHADVPVDPAKGALVADIIVDRNVSAILDLSQIETDLAASRFAREFVRRLFQRRKQKRAPTFLFLEEAQEFLPQNPASKEENFTLGAFNRLGKIGRNFGLGMAMISQRPQEVSKKTLNAAECVFAFQLNGTQERDAVKQWLRHMGGSPLDADVLPSLEVGQPHVWSPTWLKVSRQVRISKKRTFDASSTPSFDAEPVEVRPLEAEDLAAIREAMEARGVQVDESDPKKLAARIGQLERDLELARARQSDPAREAERYQAGVEAGRAEVAPQLEKFRSVCESLRLHAEEFITLIPETEEVIPVPTTSRFFKTPSPSPGAGMDASDPGASNGSSGLPKAERAFLTVLAQRRGKRTSRNQLAVTAGYSAKSRHVDNVLGSLRSRSFVEGGPQDLAVTEDGVAALGFYDPLPTGRALGEFWLQKLEKAPRDFLAELLRVYPDTLARDEIAERSGYSVRSRHVDNVIGKLRSLGLIDGSRSAYRANEELC